MLVRMWSNGNTPPLLVGVQTCTATKKINVGIAQEDGTQASKLYYSWESTQSTLHPTADITCSVMFNDALFIIARN